MKDIAEIIGNICSVDNERKNWPVITLSISLVISLMVIPFCFKYAVYTGLLIVLLYWLLFFLFITFHFSKKRIFTFGTKGCSCQYRNGKQVTNTILLYKDMPEPSFNIVDYKFNGVHKKYWFTVNFGAFSFNYNYDIDDIPNKDFDYICAHKLYRYWSKYNKGKEYDFKESERVLLGRLHNMMAKDLGR